MAIAAYLMETYQNVIKDQTTFHRLILYQIVF